MQEQRISMPARIPVSLSKRFKAALALKGITAQSFFEQAAFEFTNKTIPPETWKDVGLDEQ